MALPARFSLLHSDLNDFLFAPVGEQQNGMPLNVVSGLTRLGLDPWEEAARLAALPKAVAAETLAPIITRLLSDPSKAQEMGAAGKKLASEKFTTDAMMHQITLAYASLLTRGVDQG